MNLGIKWLWKTNATDNVNVAKKNEANIFTQSQTITNAAEALIIKKTGAKYFSFRDANNMVGLLGFPTTNNNDIVFKNYVANGDLKLESNRNIIISPTGTNQLKVRNVDLQNTNIVNVNTISANPETDIRITGERDINVSPEGGNRFISRNVDVQNTNILNVANPTATKHAANKEYVDQAVAPLNTGIDSMNGTIRDLTNRLTNKVEINGITNLQHFVKTVSMPTTKGSGKILANNFDISKVVSCQLWFKRTTSGPWMLIPNTQGITTPAHFPGTLEVAGSNGIGQLSVWRQAETSTDLWVECKLVVLYNGIVNGRVVNENVAEIVH